MFQSRITGYSSLEHQKIDTYEPYESTDDKRQLRQELQNYKMFFKVQAINHENTKNMTNRLGLKKGQELQNVSGVLT